VAQYSSAQSALNWTVVGQGAIGLLAACRLSSAGYPVSLWLRQPEPLQISFCGKKIDFQPATTPIHAVLIPVKSYAVVDAVTALLPHLTNNAQLVLSHNGMGTIDSVRPLLKGEQGLWFLTTTHAALKHPDEVLHTGIGQSVLAPLNAGASVFSDQVAQTMDTALGPVTLTEDITAFLWQKLAINAAINPLTAIHNCRNGALAQPEFKQQLDAVVAEVCLVAQASGVLLDRHQLQHKVQQVISATAQNYSSMQQDVQYKRRTEIEAINGYVVQQAKRYQLAVPHNEALLQQVRQRSGQA